jgi:hypothetical protein
MDLESIGDAIVPFSKWKLWDRVRLAWDILRGEDVTFEETDVVVLDFEPSDHGAAWCLGYP